MITDTQFIEMGQSDVFIAALKLDPQEQNYELLMRLYRSKLKQYERRLNHPYPETQ